MFDFRKTNEDQEKNRDGDLMSAQNETESLNGRQRMIFFGLIPLLYTILLTSLGLFIINHGKGETFSGVLIKAGKSVVQEGRSLIYKKPAAPVSTGNPMSGNTAGLGAAPATNGGSPVGAGTLNTAANVGKSTSTKAPTLPASAGTQSTGIQASSGSDFMQKTDAASREFTSMTPTQAATILGSMTLKDEVYNMVAMKPQERAAILAKMDPKRAASVSNELNNFPTISSANAADIQKKLDSLPDSSQQLDELVKTYRQMPPTSAATLISELMKTNDKEAVSIMANLDDSTRASILSVMSSSNNPSMTNTATEISQRLLKK